MADSTVTTLIILGVVAAFITIAYGIIKRLINKHLRADAVRQHIIQNGIAAEATILDVWETGLRLSTSHDPLIGLRLNITPPHQAPYEAETQIFASPLQITQLQPGKTTTVNIDPDNPHNIILPLPQTPINFDDLPFTPK
jgi:hypothetical protein